MPLFADFRKYDMTLENSLAFVQKNPQPPVSRAPQNYGVWEFHAL